LRSIGVLWGYGSLAELRTAGASAIVASPVELLAALESGV
jgi:phosphoglycolate phosphatase-like HAD superfamily hydrolase